MLRSVRYAKSVLALVAVHSVPFQLLCGVVHQYLSALCVLFLDFSQRLFALVWFFFSFSWVLVLLGFIFLSDIGDIRRLQYRREEWSFWQIGQVKNSVKLVGYCSLRKNCAPFRHAFVLVLFSKFITVARIKSDKVRIVHYCLRKKRRIQFWQTFPITACRLWKKNELAIHLSGAETTLLSRAEEGI